MIQDEQEIRLGVKVIVAGAGGCHNTLKLLPACFKWDALCLDWVAKQPNQTVQTLGLQHLFVDPSKGKRHPLRRPAIFRAGSRQRPKPGETDGVQGGSAGGVDLLQRGERMAPWGTNGMWWMGGWFCFSDHFWLLLVLLCLTMMGLLGVMIISVVFLHVFVWAPGRQIQVRACREDGDGLAQMWSVLVVVSLVGNVNVE